MSLAELPKRIDSYVTAREKALEASIDHKDKFIYMFRNKAGYYVIDYLGLNHSDEKLIFTLKAGEKTL